MERLTVLSGFRFWKTALVLLAFGLATLIPLMSGGRSEAQVTTNAGSALVAPLSGPAIGGMTPRGSGRYFVDSLNNRFFETEVGNVNLPANSMLGVFLNGNQVGQIRLSAVKSGLLRLSTMMGQTVPNVTTGSALAVKNGETTILSGVFGPPPSPSPSASPSASPSPSGSPQPTPSLALYANLGGPTIAGLFPRGMSHYAEFGTARRLNFYVSHIRLAPGTVLSVFVNNAQVGTMTLNPFGEANLRLDSANGASVPTIVAGDTATVKNGDTAILTGIYRSNTASPLPSPTRSPSPSPVPTRPNRFFEGRLNGAQVVPPVTTEARGFVGVILNQAETQVQVYCGFFGLSSNQTTAAIHLPAPVGETAPAVFDLGTVGGTMGRFPPATFDVTPAQVTALRNGLWYVQIGSVNNPTGEIRGQVRSRPRPSNFLGTENEDIAVWRPSNGAWYVKEGNGYSEQRLGRVGDQPVSGDFDGDGKTDYAVFRSGSWFIGRSSDGGTTSRQFGIPGDIATRGDYDGDGQSDLTVFRPSTGTWYVEKSNGTGYVIVKFGLSGDVPVASDFDGDGRTDIAVWRPSNGVWYWISSAKGGARAEQFGLAGDVPVSGDFDGDGADDIAVYRPSSGVWYAKLSQDGTYDIRQFGLADDVPVAGNYDGDGVTDIAVFRPSTGVWYIWRSSDDSYETHFFGLAGDVPTTKN